VLSHYYSHAPPFFSYSLAHYVGGFRSGGKDAYAFTVLELLTP